LGGAGVYSVDLWRKALLEDESWKYDTIPEIMDGKNVADFVDPDIDAKLAALEKEEALELAKFAACDYDEVIKEWDNTQGVLDEKHSRQRQRALENRLNKTRTRAVVPRKARKVADEVVSTLEKKGFTEEATKKVRARSTSIKSVKGEGLLGKRKRAASVGEGSVGRDASARNKSRMKGLRDESQAQAAEKIRRKKSMRISKEAKKGEGDRHIPDFKPKHLFSGKSGFKKDWR